MGRDDWIMVAIYAAGAPLAAALGWALGDLAWEHALTASLLASAVFIAAHFAAHAGRRAGKSNDRAAPVSGRVAADSSGNEKTGSECVGAPSHGWAAEALAHRRAEIHLQPIVSLRDGAPRHYQALTCLRGESGGLRFPHEFLGEVEAANLSATLDNLQLAHIFDICARLGATAPEMRIFCRVQPGSLASAEFRRGLIDHLGGNRWLAARMIFECDAAALQMLAPEARRDLAAIEALGFELCAVCERLEVSAAHPGSLRKIGAPALLAADAVAIAAVRDAGMTIIASGAETRDIGDRLKALGVSLAQGDAFGRARAARFSRHAA